jgi:hypothetical protein
MMVSRRILHGFMVMDRNTTLSRGLSPDARYEISRIDTAGRARGLLLVGANKYYESLLGGLVFREKQGHDGPRGVLGRSKDGPTTWRGQVKIRVLSVEISWELGKMASFCSTVLQYEAFQ